MLSCNSYSLCHVSGFQRSALQKTGTWGMKKDFDEIYSGFDVQGFLRSTVQKDFDQELGEAAADAS